jgi:hypothetical protein
MKYDANQIINLEAKHERKTILHTRGIKERHWGLIRYLLGVGFDPSRGSPTLDIVFVVQSFPLAYITVSITSSSKPLEITSNG